MNTLKTKIQNETITKVFTNYKNKTNSLILLATGVGKSRIGILSLCRILKLNKKSKALVVVPTDVLKKNDIPNEFIKWNQESMLERVDIICYKSLINTSVNNYKFILFDEMHNLTENNIKVLDNYKHNYLGMTGTYPRHKLFIKDYFPEITKEITLDDAHDKKLVSDFKIVKLGVRLSEYEMNKYNFYTKKIIDSDYDSVTLLSRARFIYSLKCKFNAAQYLLNNYNDQERIIIFSGNIDQTKLISNYVYHSKSSNKDLNSFRNKEINRLAVVDSLNEGVNVDDVNIAIMLKTNSNEKNFYQKLGRILRGDDHAIAYLIYAIDTVEENWVNDVLSHVNDDKVKTISFNKLKSKIELNKLKNEQPNNIDTIIRSL